MPEKRPRAFIFWRIEQLLRRTLLHQPPLFEVQDFFRQSERLGGRMGGENQRAACVPHVFLSVVSIRSMLRTSVDDVGSSNRRMS